ncbi:MAG: SpoIIE family protein phosphatase [Microscillaceae bacterium]|jgi:serine phosphatase RsbU (regulator of sigma subunit)|nr:SpoIIE family protein phosphatase [Microscillaceae bacterium]
MHRYFWYSLWIFWLGAVPVLAQVESKVVNDATAIIEINSVKTLFQLETTPLPLYQDENGNLSIQDISQADFQKNFRLADVHQHTLVPNAIYWLKLRLKSNLETDSDWILSLGKITHAQVYIPQNTGKYEVKHTGQFVETAKKEVKSGRYNSVNLFLPAKSGTITIFIRFENKIDLPPDPNLLLLHKTEWQEQNNFNNLMQGFFQGLLWMTLLYNLLLFVTMLDRAYLYYVLYIATTSVYFLNFYGYWGEFVMGDYPMFDYLYMPFTAHLGFIFYMFFMRHYLQTPKHYPKWDIILVGVTIAYGVMLILLMLLLPVSYENYLLAERIFYLLIQAGLLVVLVFLFALGDSTARFLAVGTALMIAGGAMLLLGAMKIFTLQNNIIYYELGVLAQIFVFSLGLSARFKQSEIDRQIAQRNLIYQLEENQKLQTKVTRELENKVRERTEEIEQQKWKIVHQSEELQTQSEEIARQNKLLEHSRDQITDSITYASRIQVAIFDSMEETEAKFKESFIYLSPKDIVSGDFYWYGELLAERVGGLGVPQKKTREKSFTERIYEPIALRSNRKNNGDMLTFETIDTGEARKQILIAADCTGHGVPGAFMTVLGYSILNEIVNQKQIYEPDEILYELDESVIKTLRKRGDKKPVDGMEITVMVYDENKRQITYAAAGNPLYLVRDYEMQVFPASKNSIGYSSRNPIKVFEKNTIDVKPDDVFYMTSDGFHDQFGGSNERGQKYLKKRMREFLLKISHLPMAKQKEKIDEEIKTWMGSHKQTDDILMVGIKF